eukprot:m.549198 g.549198  ORF g.549198 m.549198 type:complete len:110 (+) comp22158_c1_seq106:296-625(+)
MILVRALQLATAKSSTFTVCCARTGMQRPARCRKLLQMDSKRRTTFAVFLLDFLLLQTSSLIVSAQMLLIEHTFYRFGLTVDPDFTRRTATIFHLLMLLRAPQIANLLW